MNALLIIDMQEAYFKTPGLIERKDTLVNNINALVTEHAKCGDLIINIRTVHQTDKSTWSLNMLQDDKGFAFEGAEETLTLAELRLENATQLAKTRDSAFHGTGLYDLLHSHGITTITLAGVSTHNCIFQTASDAYAHNIAVHIATSAVDDEDGDQQRCALDYLQREYRQVVE